MPANVANKAALGPDPTADGPDSTPSRRRLNLGLGTISGVYLLAAEIILFAIIVPDTFLTWTTIKTLLSEQAVTAILAVGLILPLAAAAFDLSIAMILGFAAIFVTELLVGANFGVAPAIVVTLAAGAGIGAINALMVVKFKIQSIIATLAMSSVLTALVLAVSNNEPAIGVPEGFSSLGASDLFGIQLPVYYLALIGIVVWYVLEQTPAGRYLYATGGNREAARLAGVRVDRYLGGSLIVGALIATLAGIIATARVGAGSPEVGPPYLLPAFAAAFLGATQFKRGRYNVPGTILAVYVLAVGVKGLQLAGAPFWLPNLFNGVALALAVGLAGYERKAAVNDSRRRVQRLKGRRKS